MNKNQRTRTRDSKRAEKPSKPAENTEERGFFSSRVGIVLLTIVALAFIVYSLISLSGIHSQIRERQSELDEIKDEITVQEIKNEEMNKTYSLTDSERSSYMERLARDQLDYVKEGERVFVNVAGE